MSDQLTEGERDELLQQLLPAVFDHPPPSDLVELSELPEISLPGIDKTRIHDDDFLDDLVEAANTVRKYLMLCAGIWPTRDLDSNVRGVLIGHAVRLFKLYDHLAYLIADNRGDFTLASGRMIADTIIRFEYFLRHPDTSTVDEYIRQTLAHEKKLILEIEARMDEPPKPIEADILRSAKGFFERAGVGIGDVKSSEWQGSSTSDLAKEVGLESLYEFVFRSGSHNVHGTWHDLFYHHLEMRDGEYRPKIRYSRAAPQMLEFATIATLDVMERYLTFALPDIKENPVLEPLRELRDWFGAMTEQREARRGTDSR